MTPQYKLHVEMIMQHAQVMATIAIAYAQMGYKEDAIGCAEIARSNAIAAMGKAHDLTYRAGERIDNP